MAEPTCIAVDLAGGDAGVAVTAEAVDRFLSLHDARLLLAGRPEDLDAAPLHLPGVEALPSGTAIPMAENPARALRGGRDSTLWNALQALAEGRAQAAVSAGNTGAMLALACHLLPSVSGVRRPAICAPLPTVGGHCHLLDLGANLDCDVADLRVFAHLGSVLARTLDGSERPRVGVLNVGTEPGKGTETLRQLDAVLLRDEGIHYVGFVEGDSVFRGEADVVVSDGFSGNILLKACEGTARLVESLLTQEHQRAPLFRDDDAIRRAAACIDPDQHAGASFLGLGGVVVKSHGNSGVAAFVTAMEHALQEARRDLPALLEKEMAELPSLDH